MRCTNDAQHLHLSLLRAAARTLHSSHRAPPAICRAVAASLLLQLRQYVLPITRAVSAWTTLHTLRSSYRAPAAICRAAAASLLAAGLRLCGQLAAPARDEMWCITQLLTDVPALMAEGQVSIVNPCTVFKNGYDLRSSLKATRNLLPTAAPSTVGPIRPDANVLHQLLRDIDNQFIGSLQHSNQRAAFTLRRQAESQVLSTDSSLLPAVIAYAGASA